MPHGAGLASMNSFGMAAFLGGPVLIGLIAEASNLRIAFMVVAATAVLWIIQAVIIKRKKIIS
jgi:MFS family permease